MSLAKNSKKRKWFSNLVLASFILLVLGTAFLTNVFKTPIKNPGQFIEQSLVFGNKELDTITQLTLKNKSGEYIFDRADTSPTSAWHMTSPRDISANSIFVEKLFHSLNIIKTKNTFPDNTINNSNFSLDKPTSILELTDKNGKSILISVGIMNTIDSSTYIKISGKTNIYQVEAPSVSLEDITLSDLVESSVFDLNFSAILNFKIFKKNSTTAIFEVVKKDGRWINTQGIFLDEKRLEDIIDDFIKLKSSYILDQLTDAQKKQTQALINAPEYVLKVEKENNEIMIYHVSSMTKSLPDVALKEPHFIIIESHAPVVYIIKKDFFTLFEIKNDILKTIELPN